MDGSILTFLKDLIEGGFIGQVVIATLVWGAITIILVMRNPVDDRLFDAGFIILGYFFHVAVSMAQTRGLSQARRNLADCNDEGQDTTER